MKLKNEGSKLGDVTLVKGCLICQEEIILLATRNSRKPLPEKGTTLPNICDKCKKEYLSKGTAIIRADKVDEGTKIYGDIVVVKDEKFKEMFPKIDNTKKIVFMESEAYQMLFRKAIKEVDK